MAMTPTLFTVSGLAVELGKDRRTVAKALSRVPPDGKSGKHDAWRLSTALAALGGPSAKAAAPDLPTPPGLEFLRELPPEQGAILSASAVVALAAIYAIRPIVASVVVGSGGSCAVAYTAANCAVIALAERLNETDCLDGELQLDPQAIGEPNWKNLAAMAGEPVDLEAWQAHQAKKMEG